MNNAELCKALEAEEGMMLLNFFDHPGEIVSNFELGRHWIIIPWTTIMLETGVVYVKQVERAISDEYEKVISWSFAEVTKMGGVIHELRIVCETSMLYLRSGDLIDVKIEYDERIMELSEWGMVCT